MQNSPFTLDVLLAPRLIDAYERLRAGFVNPLYGVHHIALTPIPFNTEENYAFLDLPQVFHWMFMPFLVYGVVRIWRRATLAARFVVVYFVLMIFLYGVFGELQGPRHKVQLDGIIALFKFYGIIGAVKQIIPERRGLHPTGSGCRGQLICRRNSETRRCAA
jgi:hypothetical protein